VAGRRHGAAAVIRRLGTALVLSLLATAVLVVGDARPAEAAGCDPAALAGDVARATPVVLVHGFSSSPDAWSEGAGMEQAMGDIGRTYVTTFDYSRWTDRWVTDSHIGPALAQHIACLSEASLRGGGTGKVALVGHSMGGLAIRCALATSCGGVPGNEDRVGTVVTLGTPNEGSLFQFRGSSWVQSGAGAGVRAACAFVDNPVYRLDESLADLCAFARRAATSDAGHAFRQGSRELDELPEFPEGLPVHALAGSAWISTQLLFYHYPTEPFGDLVVGTGSATATTTDSPPIVIDCGDWYLTLASPVVGLQRGTCWHGSETSALPFVQATVGLVSDYVFTYGCGPKPTSPVVLDAIRQLPPYDPGNGDLWEWSEELAPGLSNFDPCATLSGASVHIEGATGGSPMTVLLFHKGQYVGTATSEAYAKSYVDTDESTDDTVVVSYTYDRPWDRSSAEASGLAYVHYRWDGQRVQMLDELPPDMLDPPRYAEISLEGFGPFAWGAGLLEAESELGWAFDLQDLGLGCSQGELAGLPGVTFAVQDGEVVGAATGDDSIITDTGIQVGDSVAELRAAYPLISSRPDPSDAYSTRFEFDAGDRTASFVSYDGATVDWMFIGRSDVVGEAPCV
jgi:pimeloyl-ACP methyl ester carboxylesterase